MGIIQYLSTDPTLFFILVVCLVFSLTFHEYAHGIVAYYYGDDTAYNYGRLTLNPLAHLDPIGTFMILFIGIGYAKPVPVNPNNLENPRRDIIKVAAAGPLSNLLLTFISIIIFNLIVSPSTSSNVIEMLKTMIYINTALAVFNLIPVYPLDGGQIFGNIIGKYNPNFANQLLQYGPKILLFVILFGIITGKSILWMFIGPIVKFIITTFDLLIGFFLNIF